MKNESWDYLPLVVTCVVIFAVSAVVGYLICR